MKKNLLKCRWVRHFLFSSLSHKHMVLLLILSLNTFQIQADTVRRGESLSVSFQNTSLKEIFREVERKTGYRFFYSTKAIDETKKVSIALQNVPVETVVSALLSHTTDVSFKIRGDQIMLKRSKQKNQSARDEWTASDDTPAVATDNNPLTDALSNLNPAYVEYQNAITGKVSSHAGEPLPGVNILQKGTTNGTTTDADGKYSIVVPDGDAVLVFSFIGYTTQEVSVNGRSVIDIALAEDVRSLDEIVVIGYGTQKKSDLTGAVTRVEAEKFQHQPMTQLTDMLTGTVAGFYGNQGTTAAGGASLEIRGPTSLNAGTAPMIVLDGVIYNGLIRDINPNDIETIDILKDASSAAVYGSRAANGVIIVTTKKGTTGKPVINFSTQVGMAVPGNRDYRSYDAEGYLDFRRDLLRGLGTALPDYAYFSPNELPEGVTLEDWRSASNNPNANDTEEWLARLRFFPKEMENYLAGKSTNWFDEVMMDGKRQNYDISIGGGADNFKYYWSINYVDNEGIVRGDQFSTIRSRLNVDFKVTDFLNVGVNTQFANRDESTVQADMNAMFVASPYGSVFNEDGSIRWYPHDYEVARNPLINYYGQDRDRKTNSLLANLYADVKLPFGITYNLSFQPQFSFGRDNNFWSSETIAGGRTRTGGYGIREESGSYSWIVNNILKWNKRIGVHNLDVTLLHSGEKGITWYSRMANETFIPNEALGYHALQFGSNPSLRNNDTQETGDALMGRINYSLMDKYMFTGSIRRDGYSAFGQENPRSTFPAAAFAWNISNEDFFPKNFAVDRMKLRFSWGVNGNRDIGAYSALAQIGSSLYYNGSKVQIGVFNNTLGNPGLVWERTESINIGIDFGLFNDRIDLSAEYYDMTTTNLLMKRKLPRITGFSSVTSNLGELQNRGFEFSLNTVNVNRPGFSWRSNVIFSLNRNEIKSLFGDYEEVELNGKMVRREVPDYANEWFPGQAIDVVWNYKVTGVWQVDEADVAETYNMDPGDFKAVDVDNSGAFEELIDKQFIGYTRPRHRLGFRNDFSFLKNFTASVFLRADLGHIRSFNETLHNGSSTYDRNNTYAIPYWTPDNPINDYARLTNNTDGYGGVFRIYKPTSFLRVQDVSLAYALPEATSRRFKLSNFRVFASVRNLATFTEWPGWDPESGDEPMPKIYTFGLNFSL